jgi:hypothetical protein
MRTVNFYFDVNVVLCCNLAFIMFKKEREGLNYLVIEGYKLKT